MLGTSHPSKHHHAWGQWWEQPSLLSWPARPGQEGRWHSLPWRWQEDVAAGG